MKKRARKLKRGAAMLVVLLVLLMTTATATFAIHATTVEIRAAGFARQAQQTEHVAEGGAHAAVAYVDRLKANGSLIAILRTDVAANTEISPGETTGSRATNLLRVELRDFVPGSPGLEASPLEIEGATPSLGPNSAYRPNFTVDGTDVYTVSRDQAGQDLSGRGTRFYRMSLTSRATLSTAGTDYRSSGDTRDYHEAQQRARAYVEVGPFWAGGH